MGSDDRFLLVRRGRWRRETDLLPHEKVQSVRISQGAVQRRLGLATLHVDTTPGPVPSWPRTATPRDARALLDAEVAPARAAAGGGPTGSLDAAPVGAGRAYRGPVRSL